MRPLYSRDCDRPLGDESEPDNALRTRLSYRACFSAFVLCAMRLSGIFNDEKSVCACKFQNRVHVRWLPEKVNRNDRFGSLGQTLFKFRRVHRECILVYIYKHWSGLAVGDRLGSGDKRVRNRNDFIAFANSQRQESKPKRISAVAHAYRVGGPAELCDLNLGLI